MKIHQRNIDDIIVVDVDGNMTGGIETKEFNNKIKEIMETGKNRIILNLGKVTWINSMGLGNIMAAFTTIKNKDGILKIANPSDSVRQLLELTYMISIIETYDEVHSAIDSFND